MTSSATVTIPYTEFEAIQKARRDAETMVARLNEQTRQNKIADTNRATLSVARAALEISRFAIASMPAESTHGWPLEALRTLAQDLTAMPDATEDDRELALTIGYFADEVERFEIRRQALRKLSVEKGDQLTEAMLKGSVDQLLADTTKP